MTTDDRSREALLERWRCGDALAAFGVATTQTKLTDEVRNRAADALRAYVDALAAALEEVQRERDDWVIRGMGAQQMFEDCNELRMQAKAEVARLRKALELADRMLAECDSDYNHPRFTDRHSTGPRITAVRVEVAKALAASPPKEEGC